MSQSLNPFAHKGFVDGVWYGDQPYHGNFCPLARPWEAKPETKCNCKQACASCGGVKYCHCLRRDEDYARAEYEDQERRRAEEEFATWCDSVTPPYDDAAADRDYEQRCARGVECEQQLDDATRAWR